VFVVAGADISAHHVFMLAVDGGVLAAQVLGHDTCCLSANRVDDLSYYVLFMLKV
jgi:hypothetical protein